MSETQLEEFRITFRNEECPTHHDLVMSRDKADEAMERLERNGHTKLRLFKRSFTEWVEVKE